MSMGEFEPSGPTEEVLRTIRIRHQFLDQVQLNPSRFWPFLKPCDVKVLMVVDGLDFSEDGFGLSTFVRTLLDMPHSYVRFQVTLAHIGLATATQMMDGESRITRRITQFRFDNPDHFTADMYDEVMLFGIAPIFAGRGTDSNGNPYPTDRLADPELRALTQFMNAGGGLFATGDHGRLGRFLGHAVPRARSMRLWQETSAQNALDEVSMAGARRNDTNRIGSSPGSQFDDQSDDTPQMVQPLMYRRTTGILRFSFPHPLLCGPKGVINVMPDHPHEGECIVPSNTGLSVNIGGSLGPEYPNATDGGPKPLPEVISTSTVLAGTTSSGKAATVAHSFGGIGAYDGHRAGVGRVVTDATWHHFVNINLIGDRNLPATNPKHWGFLYSSSGQEHLEAIQAYFRNIGVWLAPPARIACMNTRLLWHLVWTDRVLEAVLSTTDLRLREVPSPLLLYIGKHARDALGRFASQCQTVRLILDLILVRDWPQLVLAVDPWIPDPPDRPEFADGIDWFHGAPLLDMALGAGLLALREAYPRPDETIAAQLETDELVEVVAGGGGVGVEHAFRSLTDNATAAERFLKEVAGERPKKKATRKKTAKKTGTKKSTRKRSSS